VVTRAAGSGVSSAISNPQFFTQLAPQRLRRRLLDVDVATRKIPCVGIPLTGGPPTEEDVVSPRYQSRDDLVRSVPSFSGRHGGASSDRSSKTWPLVQNIDLAAADACK
jgi:hypothetical protein